MSDGRPPECITAGDTWELAWVLPTPDDYFPDLTGASARLHVRSPGGALVLDCNTGNGLLTITPAARRIDLAVPYAAMTVPRGEYEWDVEITWLGGPRRTIDGGVLRVKKDNSRD